MTCSCWVKIDDINDFNDTFLNLIKKEIIVLLIQNEICSTFQNVSFFYLLYACVIIGKITETTLSCKYIGLLLVSSPYF